MNYKLKRELVSNAIAVSVTIDEGRRLKMILDTGASNTTIDSNMLYLYGYSLNVPFDFLQFYLRYVQFKNN